MDSFAIGLDWDIRDVDCKAVDHCNWLDKRPVAPTVAAVAAAATVADQRAMSKKAKPVAAKSKGAAAAADESAVARPVVLANYAKACKCVSWCQLLGISSPGADNDETAERSGCR